MICSSLKILHIIYSVDPAGGGPIEGIIRQNEACQAAGLEVTRELLTLDIPASPHLAPISMKVHAVGLPKTKSRLPWRRALEHYRYSPNFVPWLQRHLADYDVAVVHGLWNYASFGSSRVLPQSKTPYFVFPHGMMDPWLRHAYPLKHIAKIPIWLFGDGVLLSKARSVFFTSQEEQRLAQGQFPFHEYAKTIVPYGSSPPPSSLTEEVGVPAALKLGSRRYLLFLSRIHVKKGCDLLVEAFARVAAEYADIDLVIAGPDEKNIRPQLESLAKERRVSDRIHWPGPLYQDAKWSALRGAEAFVLPSHQENFGIAVAEALGCGTPVLISDRVNIWREIEDAGAGFVEADTVDGTESLLRQWLSLGEDRKRTMRERASWLFSNKFNVMATGPAVISSMKALLAERPG